MNRLFNRFPIIYRLVFLTAVSIIFLIISSSYLAWDTYQEKRLDRENLVQNSVGLASGIVEAAYQMETSGKLTREQAQERAKSDMAVLRYGHDDYFWINDLNANVIMHPIKPELNGKSAVDIKDPDGKPVFVMFADEVKKEKAGFVSYLWPKPGKSEPVEKISYVKGFEPWGWVVGSGLYLDDLHDEFVGTVYRILMVLLGLIAITVWISLVISRSLSSGLKKAVSLLEQMEKGNLALAINPKGNDEISHLLIAMKSMQANLADIVHTVRTGSDRVADTSSELAQANIDLSRRTESQASSLEETSAAMEQLSSTVKQNSATVHEANELAVKASKVAVDGGEAVSEVVITMQGINESSKKIADIISVIDGIAFQTNILALNAAVEAARAGEQGRGFAVVASEVRNLAGRSAAAAKEINSLINASVDQVERGTLLVSRAGDTMMQVVDSIKQVTDLMENISTSSNEQSQGVSQVSQAVSEMDRTTQENAALVEQMSASAAVLKGQAFELVGTVSVFSLKPVAAFKLSDKHSAAGSGRKAVQIAPKPVPVRSKTPMAGRISAPVKSSISGARAGQPSAPEKSGADDWEEF